MERKVALSKRLIKRGGHLKKGEMVTFCLPQKAALTVLGKV
jgi:hypothetical protein